MSVLITGILSGFLKSCVLDLPEVSKEWLPIKRALLYTGALFIYPIAIIVAAAVVMTVAIVVYPVSYLYRNGN